MTPTEPHGRSTGSNIAPDRSEAPILAIQGLSVGTGTNLVLQDISFQVHPGERVALVGESGAGKSMLLHAIAGCLPPGVQRLSGTVHVGESHGRSKRKHTGPKSPVGWIGQDPRGSFDPLSTLGAHLAEAVGRRRWWLRHNPHPARIWLPRLELSLELADLPIDALSGGMARRAAIAYALAGDAPLILGDEPTTGVDPLRLPTVLKLLKSLTLEGRALLLVTHDLELGAKLTDRLLVLHRGQLVESGPARKVIRHPRHPYVRNLVHAHRLLSQGLTGLQQVSFPSYPQGPGCIYREVCDRRQTLVDDPCIRQPPPWKSTINSGIRCFITQEEGDQII